MTGVTMRPAWHHDAMGTITARYDRSAVAYERWWAPVLAPAVAGLLDAVDKALDGRTPKRVLDIGAGTGVLARSAATRWDGTGIVGLDGSRAMLEVAAGEAHRTLAPPAATRLSWVAGLAQDLPFADRSFELAVSSFVMQLVPHRLAALREAHRVLEPGGLLAYVTWLDGGEPYEPDVIFDSLIDEERLEDSLEAEEDRSGDLPSPAAAAAQARRAGFSRCREAMPACRSPSWWWPSCRSGFG